jgi:hypothetical protein
MKFYLPIFNARDLVWQGARGALSTDEVKANINKVLEKKNQTDLLKKTILICFKDETQATKAIEDSFTEEARSKDLTAIQAKCRKYYSDDSYILDITPEEIDERTDEDILHYKKNRLIDSAQPAILIIDVPESAIVKRELTLFLKGKQTHYSRENLHELCSQQIIGMILPQHGLYCDNTHRDHEETVSSIVLDLVRQHGLYCDNTHRDHEETVSSIVLDLVRQEGIRGTLSFKDDLGVF